MGFNSGFKGLNSPKNQGKIDYVISVNSMEQNPREAKKFPTRYGFGGLQVACWPLVPKFTGSHLVEAVGFLGRKNPQHAFLRRGSKAVGPMS